MISYLQGVSRSISPEEHETRRRIAARLRQARKRIEQTLQASGDRAGVTIFTWRRYETAQASIPAEVLPRVARAVETTCRALLRVA